MWDIVILSPHMDDAALSLGQHIMNWVKENKSVKIVTIMTSFGKNEGIPKYSRNYVIKSGFGLVMDFETARRNEDVEVMKSLGVEYEHWGFTDGGFRGKGKSFFYYPSNDDLLSGKIVKEDQKIIEKINRKITGLKAKMFLVPYGVGGHIDHVVLRQAVEKLKMKNKLFYLESPYLWKNFIFLRMLKNIFKIKSFLINVKAKNKLLKKYKSQYLLWENNKDNYIEIILWA